MPMKVTTVRLTERLWHLLETQAREEGTSASALVREGAMMRLGYALGKVSTKDAGTGGASLERPFPDFGSAAGDVLDMLHERLGFALWLVTRVEGDQWVIQRARDELYGVEAGDAFPFADTCCARMIEGSGPPCAPDTGRVPAYAAAAIAKELPIAAYLGSPLVHADGSLFGTLCAVDPAPQPSSVADDLPLVQLSARLLSSLLEKDGDRRRN